MLRHFANDSASDGMRFNILWMTPNDMRSLKDMTAAIANQDKRLLHRFSPVAASVDAGIAKISTEIGIAERSSFFKDLLAAICSRIPSVLIVDEAHELGPGVASDLLNASQVLRANPDTPFFLVLSGTPGLVRLLQQARSSFRERSAIFPLGRLSAEDAMDALTRPLTSAGVFIHEDVAADVACRAHCYPYFIQIWGERVAHDLHGAGERTVSDSTVTRVEHAVKDSIKNLYMARQNELMGLDLAGASRHIAEFFHDTGAEKVPTSSIISVIRQSHMDQGLDIRDNSIMETMNKLSSIGFIWQVSPKGSMSTYYEPGIPSLMNFVVRESLAGA